MPILRVVYCIRLLLLKLTHETTTKGKSASAAALTTAAATAEPCPVRFGSTQLSSAQPVSDSAQELTTRGSSEYEPRKQSEANADAATEHRGQGGVIFSERSDQIR